MPLGKPSLPAYITPQKRSRNQQKQLCNNAFHVKTSQSAKNQLDPAKNKNRPKMPHTPFLYENLHLFQNLHFFFIFYQGNLGHPLQGITTASFIILYEMKI